MKFLRKITTISVSLLLAISPVLKGQTLLPLNRLVEQRIEREYMLRKLPIPSPFHTYYKEDIQKEFPVDSVLNNTAKKHKTWLGRKMYDESFLHIDSTDYELNIDPLFNLQVGKDNNGLSTFTNTRGGLIQGKLGEKFSFATWVYENQSRYPKFWDSIINISKVAPGQGRAKRFQTTGWDYASSGGYISWRVLKNLNLEFGQGKNFIGNGYRSMILSDVSTNYPYIKIDWTYKNLQYTKLFTSFTNLYYPFKDIREFYSKTGTVQLLSLNLGKKLQLTFLDMNVWNSPDSSGTFKLKGGMFNPIPYLSSLIKDSHEEVLNSISGLNVNYTPIKGILLYGQVIIDEDLKFKSKKLFKEKFGYQLGLKYYDVIGIKNLFAQFEVTEAEPFTYSHIAANLSMSHFQQPLAHPLGANFRESVYLFNYKFKRLFIEIRGTAAKFGADDAKSNWGKNIFKAFLTENISSEVDNPKLFQGIKTNLTTNNLELSYLINSRTNMNISAGYYVRDEKSSLRHNLTEMFYFAFRTSLSNLYFDF